MTTQADLLAIVATVRNHGVHVVVRLATLRDVPAMGLQPGERARVRACTLRIAADLVEMMQRRGGDNPLSIDSEDEFTINAEREDRAAIAEAVTEFIQVNHPVIARVEHESW